MTIQAKWEESGDDGQGCFRRKTDEKTEKSDGRKDRVSKRREE